MAANDELASWRESILKVPDTAVIQQLDLFILPACAVQMLL